MTQKTIEKVRLFTDGACSGNPGPGGWGVLMLYRDASRELTGGEPQTTNNRMELMAAIQGLESLTRQSPVALYTDSRYLCDGIEKWLKAWKQRGWRTADGKPVKNIDLWQRLEAARLNHDVTFHWVRGHDGHVENERADALARQGMAPYLSSKR
jgi:ribonuclease HI